MDLIQNRNDEIAEKALELAHLLDNKDIPGTLIENRTGQTTSFTSCDNLETAVSIVNIAVNFGGTARDYVLLAYVYLSWGKELPNPENVTKYKLAHENCKKAIQFDGEACLEGEDKGAGYANFAVVKYSLGSEDPSLRIEERVALLRESIRYSSKAIRILRKTQNKNSLAGVFHNLNCTYSELGSHLESEAKIKVY